MATPRLSIVTGSTAAEINIEDNRINKTIDSVNADKQSLLELANKLHSTLDMEQLITLFKLDITPILNLDDVIYRLPEDNSTINAKGRHLLSYQLVLHQKGLGEITMIRRTRFSNDELHFIEQVLVALLAPLNNALNYQQALNLASLDPLTGIYNRYAMENMVSREIELTQRNNTPLSMIALDIDYFKKVNDTYGHAAGDCVLKHLTECVHQCTRTTDAMFRYGGEEFILLLNNTDLFGAQELAERIRKNIEQTPYIYDGKSIKITASIGISTFIENDTSSDFFKRADEALYRAKSAGRNQVITQG
ncbi:MAG: GGDEF domain-containing protein [Gammaproteobacteria bacterium]|nr:MAG: GGDEF domain-containing protein [Gammaproteobacteria bacterium]